MTITAIILYYKNYKDVCVCIQSLEKQILPDGHTLNILVIDNNSEDDSTIKLQETFPKHRYIFNTQNLGFAKGVNQGFGLCPNSDYFLLVNNDAELSPDCLNLLIEIGKNESLVGPAIFYKTEPDKIWQGGGFFSKLKMGVSVPDKNLGLKPRASQRVDFLSGCILLIPKNVIGSIGNFDEKFFFYGEDLDFCLRAKKAGIPVIYCSEAKAWHNIKPIARSRTGKFVLQNLAFSYQLIIKKHYRTLRIYGLFLFIFIYTPFRFYQIISGGNNWKNIGNWFKGGIKGWQTKI